MSEPKKNKEKVVRARVSEADYNKVYAQFERSTCRKLSEYVRKKLLDKLIVFKTRNTSLDDFMTEMIKLRNELNSIGNNFNQAVKKLNALSELEEFRFWVVRFGNDHQDFMAKMDEIKGRINQMSDVWLQS